MRITYHGGSCCGIKQISSLWNSPDWKLAAIKHKEGHIPSVSRADAWGHEVKSTDNFYPFERPAETGGERFDAYMDFLRKHRPQGLVEVTIIAKYREALEDSSYVSKAQEDWIPFLKKRGFKRVARFANSNSGNFVEVYHYIMTEPFDYYKKLGIPRNS
jgi:hypothetical protein